MDDQPAKIDPYWWNKDKNPEGHHRAIFALLNHLDKRQRRRAERNTKHLKLVGGDDPTGLNGPMLSAFDNEDALTLNIIKSMVGTVSSQLAQNKTRVAILTSGGDWKLRRRGQKLEKYIAGIFHKTGLYAKGRRVFWDATVCDTGVAKIYRQGADIIAERVFPDEVIVDEADALYGEPRSIYQRKLIPREVLLALYAHDAKKQAKIREAKSMQTNTDRWHETVADTVLVAEAWHLRSSEEAGDGLHVIAIDNADLEAEEYEHDYFPFVPMRWGERPRGWYGESLAGDLVGIQYEVNTLLLKFQDCMRANAPRVGIETGSQIVYEHVNNEPWTFIEFSKTPPVPLIWPSLNPGDVEYLEKLIGRAYEVAGISENAAQAKKPAGVEAAVAIREVNDIQSARHILVGQRLEEFYIECARRFVDLAKEIAKDPDIGAYEVQAKSGKFLETIDWEDVDLDRDAYMMQSYPTSFLPQTPSGRLQTIQEMMDSGLLTREEGMALLDYPDLESTTELINADLRYIDMLLEEMLDKGKPRRPDAFVDKKMAIRRMGQMILKAELDGYPEAHVELVREYVSEADALLAQEAPPPQPAPAAPGQPPAQAPQTAPVAA